MFLNGNVVFSRAKTFRGGKFVWWKDAGTDSRRGVANGNLLKNPFKNGGWAFAGDLFEYNISGEGYLLKVFQVAKGITATDTEVLIKADGYSHVPEVGNVLMKAPTTVTGTGAAGIVLGQELTTTVDEGQVWKLTITAGALGTLAKDDLLVEAEEAGAGKKVLVKNPNTFVEVDTEFEIPTNGSMGFQDVAYNVNTIYGKAAYEKRMCPLPAYVKTKNRSYIDGLFEL